MIPEEPLVIHGAGGHAAVVAQAWMAAGGVVAAFVSPQPPTAALPAPWSETTPGEHGLHHLGFGELQRRREAAGTLVSIRWGSVIDPRAVVSDGVTIDAGAFVAMGALIQARARIGRHAIVNTGAVVEHDVVVGAFSHVAPGSVLLGGVSVGDGVMVGARAVVLPGLRLGDGAVIGAGAVVTRDVDPGARVVGVPARSPA
ncbi:NeuD/PglB/VioB family sugar acetyltransferase [Brevundimonas balnearis]|uniref:NeuD/PglB/VioB family sugar acetyltransferase n=1 Tax=Brevundimonas balnearis TaxID=1572858 RepID=A0ABV6R432_9CAUL